MVARKKRKAGQQPYEPTEQTRRSVVMMKIAGLTEEMMAACLGICEQTLRKYYRSELDTGKAKIDAEVANTIVNQTLAGNTTLAIWYSKARMGWKETVSNEHTGKDGAPIGLTIEFVSGRSASDT